MLLFAIGLLLIAGIAWVIYSITQPVELPPIDIAEHYPEVEFKPQYEIDQPIVSKAVKVADTVPIEAVSTLGYCAAEDVEIVGFDWDTRQALYKTNSLNWQSINTKNLYNLAQFQYYKKTNNQLIYPQIPPKVNSDRAAIQATLNDREGLDDLLSLRQSGVSTDDVIQQYAGDVAFLLRIMRFNIYDFSIADFRKLAATHPPFSYSFVYDVLSNASANEVGFIKVLINNMDANSVTASSEGYSIGALAVSLLARGQEELFLLISDFNIPIEAKYKKALYFAYANGLLYQQDESSEASQSLELIRTIAGAPSANDILMMSQGTDKDPQEELMLNGISLDNYLKFSVNDDILGMEPKALQEKLNEITNQWPNYVMRINPNSDCQSETSFHWDDAKLIAWLNERITEPTNMQDIDTELVKISRLYVERARFLYITQKLEVPYPQFNFTRDREFEQRLFSAFGSEVASDAGFNLAELFSESLTKDQEQMVKMLLVSMISNPDMMDASINLGLNYDDTDMLNAIRFQNVGAIKWLAAMDIGFGGTDEFGNGALYWSTIFETTDVLNKLDASNLPKVYNPNNLNPHELHYSACQHYGDTPAIIREFEVGKDLKQQLRTDICEQISGYTTFTTNLGSE